MCTSVVGVRVLREDVDAVVLVRLRPKRNVPAGRLTEQPRQVLGLAVRAHCCGLLQALQHPVHTLVGQARCAEFETSGGFLQQGLALVVPECALAACERAQVAHNSLAVQGLRPELVFSGTDGECMRPDRAVFPGTHGAWLARQAMSSYACAGY